MTTCKTSRSSPNIAERQTYRPKNAVWQDGGIRGRGFTLVELLIVISIIGVLIALIMPAINSARESGRRTQCSNNLHQMALACLAHESQHGHLPAGGWGWQWAGDPNRGFGIDQPGGWHYNILPYTDMADLHDLGKGILANSGTPSRMDMGLQQSETPVAVFICPSRHKVQVFPRQHPVQFLNITDPMPRIVGRSDYAANSGSNFSDDEPGSAGQPGQPGAVGRTADGIYPITVDWTQFAGTINSPLGSDTGVIFRASALPMALIKDGASFTYMLGERYLCPDNYTNNSACDNDQGWDLGYDYDTNRWTGSGYTSAASASSAETIPPFQDRKGYCGCMMNFGSSHEAGFNMAFCDGVVKQISYQIDQSTHMQLGHRSDGQPTQLQNIDMR